MIALLIIPLAILAIVALKWGLSPYFIWKKMAEEPFNDTFTIVTLQGKQPLSRYLEEKQKQPQAPQFSMVIPAYNEVKRLPNMLPKAIEHFEKMKYSYEIVIVNDASKDKTTEVALSFAKYNGKPIDLKVLEYTKNQGKGGAVRTGCMAAVGDVVLMIDADGASEISEFEKCLAKLRSIEVNGHALVAGSRNHEEEQLIRGRFEYRMFMSKCSNFIVQTIIGVKLKDTQCGFKLFTNKSAKRIFKALHIRRWAFDVELFVIADYAEIPYCEIPISYTDQEDSKLNIVTDTIQMARDYLLIRLLYIFGLWTKDHSDNIWEEFIPSAKVRETTRKSSPVRAKRE